jgi:hypothetical protein
MKMLLLLFSAIPLGFFAQNQAYDPFKEPEIYSVIFSEIMADPIPSVMLPDAEYLEIFNRGTSAVNLKACRLTTGNHRRVLDSAIIEPGEYLIICDQPDESLFHEFGKVLPVQNMPAIVNAGQTLTLQSPHGAVIHTVTYSPGWYGDPRKSEGGWSLEIIDPDNPCGSSENWTESKDPGGGTPGRKNSVDDKNPDVISPFIRSAAVISDSVVQVLFSERMDSATLCSPWQYSASDGLLHPAGTDPIGPDYSAVLLSYPRAFDLNVRYTLNVLNSLQDCAGNSISPDAAVDFAIPNDPEFFDLVFNEILFNIRPDQAEFIELYNRSSKVLDMSDFSITLTDMLTGNIRHKVSLIDNSFLLFPDSYVVITKCARELIHDSFAGHPGSILEPDGWFALPDEEGLLALLDSDSRIIDELYYCESMHTDFLHETEGVSLERTDPDKPAGSVQNWHSASTAAGYSTPCRLNSQAIPEDIQEEVILRPEVISPDNDGMDDYLTLQLKTSKPGCMATVTVYDTHGNKIRDLVSRALLGTDEYFIWDGMTENQETAEIGLYMLYIEIVDPKGNVKKIKKVVSLARHL